MAGAGTQVGTATPEAEAISEAQVRCLAEQIGKPSRYTQRCVEQMGFLPDGGLKWTRTIQIRIPPLRTNAERWWPVSLGTFPRKRFADLEVTDANGHRVGLLTRRQHGYALARVILAPHIEAIGAAPVWQAWQNRRRVAPEGTPHERLLERVSELLTHMPLERDEAERRAHEVDKSFVEYASSVGADDEAANLIVRFSLGMELAPQARYTRYLAWVRAEPGTVITLTARYSALDVVYRPVRTPERLRERERADDSSALRKWWRRIKARAPSFCMRRFQAFGYAPLRYSVRAPANTDANSYYFIVAPPATTTTLALITDVDGSHPADGDVDSAAYCFHTHNEGDRPERPGAVLWPYLLPERREHTLIAAGAVLNVVFAYLISHGHFINGISAQTWLLLTPTVVTGIIAQQQTHYYAHATRWLRVALYLYLMLGVAFLVTVTFSHQDVAAGSTEWYPFARVVFIAFATYSTFIAFVYGLGPRFEATVHWRMQRLTRAAARRAERRRATEEDREPKPVDESRLRPWVGRAAVVRYQRAVLEFCTFALLIAVAFAAGVGYTGYKMARDGKFIESAAAARASGSAGQSATVLGPVVVFPGAP